LRIETGRLPYQKGQKKKRPKKPTIEESAYMRDVKSLPCAICGKAGASDAHHCFSQRFGQRKSSHMQVIPLCKIHHQVGLNAIHNNKKKWESLYGFDFEYIPETLEAVEELRLQFI